MKNKYLITGGAGFIGSCLVRHLIKDLSAEVIVLDKLTYASSVESLDSVKDSVNFLFLKADICDRKRLKSIFEDHKPNKVIHLAAESHVDNSIKEPENFILTNIIGTYNLLMESLEFYNSLPEQAKKTFTFHHVSTDEVFGDLAGVKFSANEDSKYKPSSPYSASKASSDHLVDAWQRTFKLPTLITNCSNNYGPHQHREKLIPTIIHCLMNKKQIPIYGDGAQIRDWLYVQDHVDALIKVSTDAEIGSRYNISGRVEISNLELVKIIIDEFKVLMKISPNERWPEDLITFVQDRPGHDKRYSLDSSKIEKDLSWSPQVSIKDGIKKTVEWYLGRIKDIKD